VNLRIVSPLLLLLLLGCAGSGATPGAAAPKIYVGNFKDNTVSVIDSGSRKVVATIPVAAGPHGMGVSPDGKSIYVSGDGASTVSVIDAASDRVVKEIEVGKAPHGLAVTSDGRQVVVAVYGEDKVSIVDSATREVVGSVPVAKPHNVAIHPDGRTAYVASQEPGKFALVAVDLQQRVVLRSMPLDKTPRALEFSPDGKALYFTQAGLNALVVLDTASGRVVTQIPVGASPHYANFTRDGKYGLVVSQGPNELTTFHPSSNTVDEVIRVGKLPHWVTASQDGTEAYVSNEGSNDVSIVDLKSGNVVTVPVGKAPRKIVVQPRGSSRAAAGLDMSASAGASAPASAGVRIANFAFEPAATTIAAGQTVTWTNADAAPHAIQVSGRDASAILAPGAVHSERFDRAGDFAYVCAVHPYMTGRIVVK
jgi:YVTN family beta-propeller protein